MATRNAARSLMSEATLAARIAFEREKLGMSFDGLAKRMTDIGCAINQSSLFKLEKFDPPRRITVNELVAFSKVFNTSIDDLLLPLDVLHAREIEAARDQLARAYMDFEHARHEFEQEKERLTALLSKLGVHAQEVLSGISSDGFAWSVTDAAPPPPVPVKVKPIAKTKKAAPRG